jgi:hypothetical protein
MSSKPIRKDSLRLCEFCGSRLEEKRSDARFCSDDCRVRAWQERRSYALLGLRDDAAKHHEKTFQGMSEQDFERVLLELYREGFRPEGWELPQGTPFSETEMRRALAAHSVPEQDVPVLVEEIMRATSIAFNGAVRSYLRRNRRRLPPQGEEETAYQPAPVPEVLA